MSRLITSNVLSKTVNLGSTAYLASANPVNLVGKSMTVESWVKLPVNDGVDRMVLSIPAAYTTGNCLTFGWRGNRLFFGFYGGDIYSGYTSMDRTLWHHVAASYNYSTKIIKLFINGAKVQESPSTVDLTGIYNAWIGRYYTYYMGGSVCEFRLWDIERTEAEIASNYNKILSPTANTVLNYSFNGVLTDKSVNNNHLSLAAGTTSYVSDAPSAIQIAKLLTSRFNKALNPLSDIEVRKTTYDATTVQDLSANNKDAILSGGAAVSNDYIEIFDANDIVKIDKGSTFSGDVTVDIWVNIDSSMGTFAQIVSNCTNRGALSDGFGFRRSGTGSNMQVWGYGANCKFSFYKNAIKLANQVAVNGTDGTVNSALELDKLVNYTIVFTGLNATVASTLFVNSIVAESTSASKSKIYAIKIYERALTDAEVFNNYINFIGGLPLVSQSKQPYALKFDGVNDYVRIPHSTVLNPESISIGFWIKTTSSSNTVVLEKGGGNSNFHIQIAGATTGKYTRGGLTFGTQVNEVDRVCTPAINDGLWHPVVMTYDKTTGIATSYTDNILRQTTTVSNVTANTLPWDIGSRAGASATNMEFIGLTFWNRELSNAEVVEYGKGIIPSGNIASYKAHPNTSVYKEVSGQGGVYTNGVQIITSTAPVGQRSGLQIRANADVVNFGNPSVFHNLTTFTVEGWLRWESSTGGCHLLHKYDAATNTGFYVLKSGNNIGLYVTDSNGTYGVNTPMVYGSWNHYTFDHDYDTGTLRVKVNNVVKATVVSPRHQFGGRYQPNSITDLRMGTLGAVITPRAAHGFLRVHQGIVADADITKNMYSYVPANHPNLIEQWKLNEGVGTVAYGTKGNNGVITGATWTTPSLMNYVGKHWKGDGLDDVVIVPSSPSLDISTNITIECWVNLPATTAQVGQFPTLIAKDAATGRSWSIWVTKYLEIRLYLNGNPVVCTPTTDLGGLGWKHVAITYDGSTIKYYIDGALHKSVSASGNITSTNSPVYIGSGYGALTTVVDNDKRFLNGSIDDVRIWNVARTQAEIQENMYKTLDRHPNLVLNMGFESGYWDGSGYGNHGTATGNPVIEVTDNDKLLLNAPIN